MDVKAVMKAAWFTPGPKHRWGLPIIIEGDPGGGKTSRVEQFAGAFGVACETVIGSLREPSDFLGLPLPGADKDGKIVRTDYAPPAWASRVVAAKRAVVMLDEINTAVPAVQAALLRVVLEGVVGDLKLPDTVRFVAAMNRTETSAGGWDLAAPLANRFGHIKWESPDSIQWADWLLGGANGQDGEQTLDPEAEEKRVLDGWNLPWSRAAGLVAGFTKARPELLFKMPEAGSAQASKAWPSPRTWEYATRAIAGAEIHKLGEVEGEELLSAFVGTGPASEFINWRQEADLPDPADLLDKKVSFKHDPKRLDRTFAVLSSCAAFVTGKGKIERKNERATECWNLLGTVINDAADIAVPAAKRLVTGQLVGPAQKAAAKPVILKMQPILAAAGIDASSI